VLDSSNQNAGSSALREIADKQGAVWRVWAVVPGRYSAARVHSPLPEEMRQGWLTFECDAEKRRLMPTPPDWLERSDDDLLALLDSASPVAYQPAPT